MAEQPWINEESTAYLTVTFKDKTGAASQPTTSRYRIDDVQSGAQIRNWTALAPTAGVVEIILTVADNTILNPLAPSEGRVVKVEGTYGADDQVEDVFVYRIKNS